MLLASGLNGKDIAMADVTTLKASGSSGNRVDFVLVAEGYTAAERNKFLNESQNFINYLFDPINKTSTDPFYTYRSLFNVHAAYIESQQSGYDANGVLVNTAFDAAAYLADGRLVYGDSNKVQTFVNSVLRPDQQDIIIVLVNSDKYGGAGGSVAWATAGNRLSYDVALHEIGHSYALLQDEYVDPAIANQYPLSALASSIHVATTSDLSRVPWKEWVGFTDSLGTIGAYEGGYYRDTGVWRATPNSKMLAITAPFSAPQKEQFINRFYDNVNDYSTLAKTSLINVKVTTPDDSLFTVNWTVGVQSASPGGSLANLEAYIRSLADGNQSFTLTSTVSDGTGLIRKAAVLANSQDIKTIPITVIKTTLGAGNDTFAIPTSGNGFVIAAGGNDRINVNGGSNFVDGGEGTDILGYAADRSILRFTNSADGRTIEIQRIDGSGVDIALSVETVSFTDVGSLPIANLITNSLNNWATYKADVEVVAATYQFFNGALPGVDGFRFLIDSATNTNDLADTYYYAFNRENRFINFAGNLSSVGTGQTTFTSNYGALSFEQTVRTAFNDIIGAAGVANPESSISFFLNAKAYYEAVAAARVVSATISLEQATKIVALGSILNEATKSDAGRYGKAVESFALDVLPDGASTALGQDLFAFFV